MAIVYDDTLIKRLSAGGGGGARDKGLNESNRVLPMRTDCRVIGRSRGGDYTCQWLLIGKQSEISQEIIKHLLVGPRHCWLAGFYEWFPVPPKKSFNTFINLPFNIRQSQNQEIQITCRY